MKRIIFYFTAVAFVFGTLTASAQVLEGPRGWSTENQATGNNVQTYISARQPLPYQHVREADVIYATRIWRMIDLRERLNHPFIFPRSTDERQRDRISFNSIMLGLGMGGGEGVQLYDDEDFQRPISPEEIQERLEVSYLMPQFDEFGNELEPTEAKMPVTSEDIVRYYVVEDWFFDKQRSVMDVRIICVAPIYAAFQVEGGIKIPLEGADVPLFYAYFPDLRPTFARNYAFNLQNTAARMSWDDLFQKRQFGSYIIKEENVYNRTIADYKMGLDALLEAEAIRERIFNFEQDMWEY